MDPIPGPLLLRKSDRDGNQAQDLWICSQELWPLDHRGGQGKKKSKMNVWADKKVMVSEVYHNSEH
jgi:hypothetical protein